MNQKQRDHVILRLKEIDHKKRKELQVEKEKNTISFKKYLLEEVYPSSLKFDRTNPSTIQYNQFDGMIKVCFDLSNSVDLLENYETYKRTISDPIDQKLSELLISFQRAVDKVMLGDSEEALSVIQKFEEEGTN